MHKLDKNIDNLHRNLFLAINVLQINATHEAAGLPLWLFFQEGLMWWIEKNLILSHRIEKVCNGWRTAVEGRNSAGPVWESSFGTFHISEYD